MRKFSTISVSKYASLRTLKRANFKGSELVDDIKMKKILKFVPSRLLK